MEFAWDPEKAAANVKKYGVEFSEAVTVSGHPLEVTIADPDYSEDEERFLSIGSSTAGRLLVVVVQPSERVGPASSALVKRVLKNKNTTPSRR